MSKTAPLPLVELGGTGDHVVLLHGYGADRQSWAANAAALYPVGRICVVDLPGHGSAGVTIGDGTVASLATQVAETLKAYRIESTHVVGHSLGGAVAIELAAQCPQRISSLSLLSPAGLGEGINQTFVSSFPEVRSEQDVIELLLMLVHNPRLISAQLAPMVLAYLNRDGVRETLSIIGQHLLTINAALTPSVNSVIDSDVPRLIVWGKQDRINLPEQARLSLFGGERHWLDDCGHLLQVEKREQVNRLLIEFLSAQRQHDSSG